MTSSHLPEDAWQLHHSAEPVHLPAPSMFELTDCHPLSEPLTRSVAMPLGGVGTGGVAMAADGSLRQWQLHNLGNHHAYIPGNFLVMRVCGGGQPGSIIRLLQGPPSPPGPPTPMVDDHVVPSELLDLMTVVDPMAHAEFRSLYPVSEVLLTDPKVPITVRVQAHNPLVPMDPVASAIPSVMMQIELINPSHQVSFGWLSGSAQNSVGWDGVTPIAGCRSTPYGGNRNRVRVRGSQTTLVMENPSLPIDHPGNGQLALVTDAAGAQVLPQYAETVDLLAWLDGLLTIDHHLGDVRAQPRIAGQGSGAGTHPAVDASAAGSTWNGALALPFRLEPGETRRFKFALTWSFPNRHVNFTQFGVDLGRSRLRLGNYYTRHHADAVHTSDLVMDQWSTLSAQTQTWLDIMQHNDLPARMAHRLAAQASLIRSPTTFQTEDGHFYGFEGVQGASTPAWADHGGSCPLNCTHVWNYAQAVASVFPSLEVDMRDTEFDLMQQPDGAIAHRVLLPRFVDQHRRAAIGGPAQPALDGMLGTVLKTLREVRRGAGQQWLHRRWPAVRRLMDHVRLRWDPDHSGLLHGPQPSTHDIDLQGINPFITGYWLAALLATERLATMVDDQPAVATARDTFTRGSESSDALMFNGEYYQQVLRVDETTEFSWGAGCLADQLVGQWWAHVLDLEPIWPVEHIRSALRAVVRHNLRRGFDDINHGQRPFAAGNETGLLNCTWPHGGRPEIPVAYCDEVWTGVEYQVAASCLLEGLQDEGNQILDGVWERHDGRRRNPYNEVECGDHYARAMAGFTVLEAMSGVRYDASTAILTVRQQRSVLGRSPMFAARAWGSVTVTPGRVRLDVAGGHLEVRALNFEGNLLQVNTVLGPGDSHQIDTGPQAT